MALAVVGIGAVLTASNRLTAIVALGIQGFCVAVLFLLFGAPDLAFTQFMIETLSVVILALVMTRLKLTPRDHRPLREKIPDAVIAICDSIEPAVQRFGQTLLLQYWRDEHAARYLLRLSEHPSVNIQLLVSSLLERHARGNLELLEQLLPCFLTVLSQVNRGGVAKQRILTFLRREAVASVEAAVLLSPLLERQSLTRAVSHKAPLIATLVDLHERYPEVAVPISTPAVPVQSRSGRGV
jgi:uncharacterized MnhB-related membrane protein